MFNIYKWQVIVIVHNAEPMVVLLPAPVVVPLLALALLPHPVLPRLLLPVPPPLTACHGFH